MRATPARLVGRTGPHDGASAAKGRQGGRHQEEKAWARRPFQRPSARAPDGPLTFVADRLPRQNLARRSTNTWFLIPRVRDNRLLVAGYLFFRPSLPATPTTFSRAAPPSGCPSDSLLGRAVQLLTPSVARPRPCAPPAWFEGLSWCWYYPARGAGRGGSRARARRPLSRC